MKVPIFILVILLIEDSQTAASSKSHSAASNKSQSAVSTKKCQGASSTNTGIKWDDMQALFDALDPCTPNPCAKGQVCRIHEETYLHHCEACEVKNIASGKGSNNCTHNSSFKNLILMWTTGFYRSLPWLRHNHHEQFRNYSNEGSVGPKGDKGDRGRDGLPGFPGRPGINGEKGDQGFPGDSGFPGISGDKGDRGLMGPAGYSGLPGISGEKGDRGLMGPAGLPGLPGVQGVGFKLDKDGNFDMNGKCLKNVGHPIDINDAVTKMYADTTNMHIERALIVLAKLLRDSKLPLSSPNITFHSVLQDSENIATTMISNQSVTVNKDNILRITIASNVDVEEMFLSCYLNNVLHTEFKLGSSNLLHTIICDVKKGMQIKFTCTKLKQKHDFSNLKIIFESFI